MDMPMEKHSSVKCPACGEMLALEKVDADKSPDMPAKKPMAPKHNAATMPMDSLKSVIQKAQPNAPSGY